MEATITPIPLPSDVIDYVRRVFAGAADAVATQLTRMPTLHEEHLDLTPVNGIAQYAGPFITASGVVVDIDLHWVGSGHHLATWEIADLGVLVVFRRGPVLLRTKVVLLQSKRLYPRESEFVADRGLSRAGGFGSLWQQPRLAAYGSRDFRFDEDCRYKALHIGDRQWLSIQDYQARHGIPVHYLLYHPRELPTTATIPASAALPVRRAGRLARPGVGTRVLPAWEVRAAVAVQAKAHAPSYAELRRGGPRAGMDLARFMTERVLGCHEGYVVDDSQDEGLGTIFNRRSGPIAAAIRFEFDLAEVTLKESQR
jgi:hypothetical protein